MPQFIRRHADTFIALGIFVVALAVYNATLCPSLSYKSPDGNELATIPYVLGLAHSPGYPLYTWLGKLFTFIPVGDVAHRINLMSATLGAGGVALLYGIMRLMGAGRLTSTFTALYFAFSRTFWSQTGIAEVYAPNVFMVALTLWLLLRYEQRTSPVYLVLAAGCFGLSLGTHLSNLGFALGIAVFVLLVDWRVLKRPGVVLGAMAAFLLGTLQFLWLPYKAGSTNDPLLLRHDLRTLEGLYRYTLGAFPQFKFAFPLQLIPDRIVLYLYLLRQNVGLGGILLGVYGMAEVLVRRTRHFYLFILMYLVHVFFFVQYRVFDLDVFFIPAHMLYIIFIGYGVDRLIGYGGELIRRAGGSAGGRFLRAAGSVGLAAVLALAVGGQVQANWEVNDYSQDTAISDFYANVFEMLPPGSVLLGRGGVFGYDMFYWRLVYNVRPDVLMPMLERPRPSPRSLAKAEHIYSTEPLSSPRRRSPWSPPPDLVDGEVWSVPVLLGSSGQAGWRPGQGRPLVLYELRREPPRLVVSEAQPQHPVGERLGGLELVGYDLEDAQVSQGGRLHLTLYWRVHRRERAIIATALDDIPLESHELGLGNLSRYVQEFHPARDSIVVEDYYIVVPSGVPAGEHTLVVRLEEPFRARWGGEPAEELPSLRLGTVIVVGLATNRGA